ncbi:SAM-dependent methyltransferase [Halioxenophilus aromaticivorans]|uniref:Methyltransferase domain-containing protein n=1 Tax=Halioxenophilus aromaticivorans TaxID=1306992 RepID=A0AAV3U8N5_9ALTE
MGLGVRSRLLHLKDFLWDWRLGVNTFGFSDSGVADGRPYSPASYRTLRQVFDCVGLGAEDVLLDVGCGLGRPVFFAGFRYPVKAGIGIDANRGFIEQARRNCDGFRGARDNLHFIECNAVQYDYSKATVIVMYNPFGADTLTKVLARIYESLQANPRPIKIVYLNPIEKAVFDRAPWLAKTAEFSPAQVPQLDIGNRRSYPKGQPAVVFYTSV